jgi:hypothetical protein
MTMAAAIFWSASRNQFFASSGANAETFSGTNELSSTSNKLLQQALRFGN